MIKPKCDRCEKEVTAFGGLFFAPPTTLPDESCGRLVAKYLICANCWPLLLDWLGSVKAFRNLEAKSPNDRS